MSRVTVVGSGASGVHFALTALKKGHEVALLDVGHERAALVSPDKTFDEMKGDLADPAGYFLGPEFEAVTLPGSHGEVYAFPPNKRYIFKGVPDYQTSFAGIEPYASFAQGGLAEAWTAGVYPFNDAELADWPIDYQDLDPYYAEVAARIGVNGEDDDLARFFPLHRNVLEPGQLDRHSNALLATYKRKRAQLQRLGCHVGRSRIATLTKAAHGRAPCSYCGRCMWGCPTEAFYTPSLTLAECLRYPNFNYLRGFYVKHFTYDDARRVNAVVAAAANGAEETFPVDNLALAAGTLSTTRIVLESIYRATGQVVRLTGLMDNRQILVPYLNLGLIGAGSEPRNYQYHQVAMGLESEDGDGRGYVHGQITTLTTGLVHPIIQNLPLNLGTALHVFRNVRTALGVVNINLHDTRRAGNYVSIEPVAGGGPAKLVAHYTSTADEPARIKRVLTRTRRALWKLGCVVPPPMVHVRHMGAGVHYSGTLPMSTNGTTHTVTPECRSNDFANLYIADGSTFPFLPAKNLTFTLMANASRTADLAKF